MSKVREPRSKIASEAVVEFLSPPIRDSVKSRGYKLEGKRTGMRLELPHFLKSDFQVLQSLSYKMKKANKDMKRSVKFDNESLGLYLDIQLPGEDWRRIRPDQARLARRTEPALRTGPAELSSDMIAGVVRGGGDRSTAAPASEGSATGGNAVPLGQRAE